MFPIIKLDWAYLVTKDMISHRRMRLCKYKFETYDDWVLLMKKGTKQHVKVLWYYEY